MIHRFIDEFGRVSPPFSAYEGTFGDGDVNVYRRHSTDAPGDATLYTDWADGASTIHDIFNPVLSPDETQIAYVARLASSGNTALYVCDNTPASASTQLVADGTHNINSPMWSPDSTTIVYTRAKTTGGSVYGGNIETVPATGGSPTVLHTPATNYIAYRPAYSYDGDYVAFTVLHTGADDGLWVMQANGTGAAEIDGTCLYQSNGSQFGWANAERTIAFYDNATGGGGGDSWVIAHDGTGKTQMSNGATTGSQMSVSKSCWLPDDSGVIFGSNQGGGFMSIYSGDPAGGAETLLSGANGPSTSAFFRGVFIYDSRLWFIRLTSAENSGTIWSSTFDGTDLVEELDVTDGTDLDWFGSGNGFEFQ